MPVTSTSFGNIQTDTKTGSARLSSKIFGVDIGELVNNLVDAKKIQITKKEVNISANSAKLAALNTLQSLSSAVQSAALNLRKPTISTGGTDVFAQKSAFLQSSNSSVAANTLFAATPTKDADLGKYTIAINRIARQDIINGTGTQATDNAASTLTGGTLSLNGSNITVTAGMTLNALKDAINAVKDTSKVQANVVKVTNGDFRISLQSTETGDAIDLTGTTGNTLTELGIAASGETDTSLSAEIVYNGQTVYRKTNTVSDLVSNTTLDLYSGSPSTTVTVEVSRDNVQIKEGIAAFVEAYNALADFNKEQRKVNTDGTVSEEAVLFSDTNLRNTYTQAQSLISGVVSGLGAGKINNLRDAGISLDEDNKLVIDDAKLDKAIVEKPSEIENLFAFKSNTTNSNLYVLGRPSILGEAAGKNITLRVLETDGTAKPTSAELDYEGTTYTLTVTDGIMYAPDNSPLKGMTFGYNGGVVNSGDPAVTTTITATQGIADLFSSSLDAFTKPTTGSLALAIQELEDNNDRIEADIEKVNARIELYRAQITQQFLAAERTVSQLESIKNSISAQVDAMNGSN
jgi:flagellar hook-associated protein 2